VSRSQADEPIRSPGFPGSQLSGIAALLDQMSRYRNSDIDGPATLITNQANGLSAQRAVRPASLDFPTGHTICRRDVIADGVTHILPLLTPIGEAHNDLAWLAPCEALNDPAQR
jgi:hypothetical protein